MPTSPSAIIRALHSGSIRGLDSIHEHMQDAMQIGRKDDADYVVVADHQKGELVCWIVVGGSSVSGETAWDHIVATHGGDIAAAEEGFGQIACMIGAQLHAPDGTSIVPISNPDSQAWRSFRGDKPMKIDEVRAKAMRKPSRKPSHN